MSQLIEVDSVEAVWNQNKGVVQLFVNGALHMELPPAMANRISSAIGHAAATPIMAASMAACEEAYARNEAVYGVRREREVIGAALTHSFPRWSPETSRDAMLAAQYEQ